MRDLIAADCDVAIVRMPAGPSSFAQEITAMGFPVVHADTLVYYECSLVERAIAVTPSEGVLIDRALPGDSEELSALVDLVFQDYPSHYAANEHFDPALAAAGYADWAVGFIDSANRHVLLARIQDRIVGFLTLEVREQTVEIVLNGVHPAWTGRGVYGSLVRAAKSYAGREGVARIIVSTQISNIAVQRAWTREGFRLYAAYDTFHVNALLRTGIPFRVYNWETQRHISGNDILHALQECLGFDAEGSLQGSSLDVVVLNGMIPGKFDLVMRSVPGALAQSQYLVGCLRDAKHATVAIVRAVGKLATLTEAPPK
ncbi:GNAT family N-acetyltransferase [Cryobacterium sp. PH31-AA6]|uniref:GNAT family N-acetyltransferase n=1 Tax=Cryobacterium sp. PH31-AA6 TaxID=3046205 RepID=UPI0024BA4CF4|nr:GNAT family N-acetyltransferase [Cryobacterium sp. PH31-AA6]MDJ0323891.1 GNAT family N-acetyltransferase [Cryobacterium sp. PH31-AA6]